MEPLAKDTKFINQLYQCALLQIATGDYTQTPQLFIGDLADPENTLDLKFLHKALDIIWSNHKLTIWFIQITGNLGQKLVRCYAS